MSHSPERIVSLQPSATVILAALGQVDRVVACTKYCADLCPEVRGRAIVADSWTAKSEEIMAARPDLVIAAVPYQEKSVSEILKAAVRFLGLAPRTLADIYTDIATIAGVVEANAIAKQLIANMKAQIELVRARTSGQSGRPRVFCEEWGKPIISSQAWVAEMVEAAGGEFLGEPGVRRTPEAVLAENPDVVITAWCGAGDRVPLQKIVRERGWEEMSAVRHSRVYCISDELLNTPAPTLLRGLEALTAAIHPELVSTIPALGQVKGLRQISETKNNPREHLRR